MGTGRRIFGSGQPQWRLETLVLARVTLQPKGATMKLDYSEIRDWARNNGHTVGTRGRLPRHVIEAYLRAVPQVNE